MKTSFIAFIITGIVCGFVDSSLGMGYGVTSASILITFGVVPAIASASIHTAEAVVDGISAGFHWKLGNVEKNQAITLIILGTFGAVLGAAGLSFLSTEFAKPIVSIVLLILGISILYKFITNWKVKSNAPRKRKYYSKKHLDFLGFIAGFVDASGGGGWGPILTSTFVATGSNPRKAVGTVEFTEPIISIAAVITFGLIIGFENFLWSIVLPILIGGIILTPVAAYLCKKIPYKLLGILVGLWVTFLNVRTLVMMLI